MELNERQMKALAALMVLMILCFGLACASSNPEVVKQRQEEIRKMEEKSRSSITTVGTGATRDEAIQDALRSAVERAVGIYIYSSTEVDNFKLVKDQIIASSRGYVKDYEIIKEYQKEGVFFMTLNVQVNVSSIQATVKKDIKSITIDEALKDYALVKQRLERIRKAEELVKAIVLKPINEAYTVEFVGYEIKSVRKDKIVITLAVKLSLNPFYWNTYYDIMNHLSEDCNNHDARRVATKYTYYGDRAGGDLKSAVCLHRDTAELFYAYRNVQIIGFFNRPNKGFAYYDVNDVHFNLFSSVVNHPACLSYITQKDFEHLCPLMRGSEEEDRIVLDISSLPYATNGFLIDPNKGITLNKDIVTKNPEFIKALKYLKFSIRSDGYKKAEIGEVFGGGHEFLRWEIVR